MVVKQKKKRPGFVNSLNHRVTELQLFPSGNMTGILSPSAQPCSLRLAKTSNSSQSSFQETNIKLSVMAFYCLYQSVFFWKLQALLANLCPRRVMIAHKITKRAEGTQSSLNFSRTGSCRQQSPRSFMPLPWSRELLSFICPAPSDFSRIKEATALAQESTLLTRPTACSAHLFLQDSHQGTSLAALKSCEDL